MSITLHFRIIKSLLFADSQRKTWSLVFSNYEKKSVVLCCGTKKDILLAFAGDGCAAYLSCLADIFETLNREYKKLQDPGTNIIVHADAIILYMAKLKR